MGYAALLALAWPALAETPSVVQIGAQRWTAANLAVTHFRNGDPIPEITDAATWAAAGRAGKPAWARYGNSSTPMGWGILYNFAAVSDRRGLCPDGLRIPTNQDWRTIEATLGGSTTAAASLKATTGWPAGGAGTNRSGFAALPAGFRTQRGEYFLGKRVAYFWTSDRESNGTTIAHMLFDDDRPLFRIEYDVAMGMSVRCVGPA